MSINSGYEMDDAIPKMGVDDENDDHDQTIEGRKGRGKKQLLRQLAQVMSGLPNRQNRLNEKRKLLEEEQLKAAKTEKDVTSTGGETGGAGGNRKKKGKKKK